MLGAQLALHLAAWRADRGRRGCGDDSERPGAVALCWSIARETALSLLVLLAWPAGASAASSGDRRRPVVLVHGFASSPVSLWVLARRLRRDGFRVATPRLGGWWRGLDDAADRLARALDDLRDDGATDVVLVAHGLAGLAARRFMQRAGRRAGVRLLVTLGTPHRGTAAAWCVPGPLRADVRPGSAALQALGTASLPAWVGAIAIATPGDAVVVPADLARWADACNVSVRGSGHLHLCVSSRVYAVIAENIAAAAAPAVRHHGA